MSETGCCEERRLKQLRDAVDEAKRFQARAEAAIVAIEAKTGDAYRCTEFAAARRASMDLTRVLAQMRKSIYR